MKNIRVGYTLTMAICAAVAFAGCDEQHEELVRDSRSGVGATLETSDAVLIQIAGQTDSEFLRSAMKNALPEAVLSEEISAAIRSALWNSNNSAAAVCVPRLKASLNFVLIRQTDGSCLAVNISGVEGPNLGFIGWAGADAYDRIETRPIRWIPRSDGKLQIVMRTRAWKSGQRYTAREALIIDENGSPLWR